MNFNLEKKDTLKGEHLNKEISGAKSIIGGIYDINNLDNDSKNLFIEFEKNGINLNFKDNHEKFLSNKTNSDKERTYLISSIDSKNKFSKDLFDCTGTCFSGIDKNTNENISFMSHQNPEAIFENVSIKQRFKDDLNRSIDNFIGRCIPSTMDVVVLGGNKDIHYGDSFSSLDIDKMNPQEIQDYMDKQDSGPFEKYRKSIFFISKIIFDKFNFYPTVISGPNSNIKEDDLTHNNALDVYFDTHNRHIYQVRAENESINNESYTGDSVNNKVANYK